MRRRLVGAPSPKHRPPRLSWREQIARATRPTTTHLAQWLASGPASAACGSPSGSPLCAPSFTAFAQAATHALADASRSRSCPCGAPPLAAIHDLRDCHTDRNPAPPPSCCRAVGSQEFYDGHDMNLLSACRRTARRTFGIERLRPQQELAMVAVL